MKLREKYGCRWDEAPGIMGRRKVVGYYTTQFQSVTTRPGFVGLLTQTYGGTHRETLPCKARSRRNLVTARVDLPPRDASAVQGRHPPPRGRCARAGGYALEP
jgi:hypothetical protein